MATNDQKIRQLENRVTSLEAKLRRFISVVGDAKEEANVARNEVSDLENKVSELEKAIDDLEESKS